MGSLELVKFNLSIFRHNQSSVGKFTLILPVGCCLGAAKGLSSELESAESTSGMCDQPIKDLIPRMVSLEFCSSDNVWSTSVREMSCSMSVHPLQHDALHVAEIWCQKQSQCPYPHLRVGSTPQVCYSPLPSSYPSSSTPDVEAEGLSTEWEVGQ